MKLSPTLCLPLLLAVGCVPEAPQELQQLACFTFMHANDDDPELLALGLDNLGVWMGQDHEEDIEEGYQINLLVDEAIAGLTGENHQITEDLVGAAVAHESSHSVEEFAQALVVAPWDEVIQDQYVAYERTFLSGEDCIGDRDCIQAEATSESELVQVGISIQSVNQIQYRWVETELGWAFMHRSWLTEPPVVSSSLVEPNSQYFLSVVLPTTPTVRVQATWIDTKIVGVNVPKSQVVSTLRDQGDSVEEWLEANY